MTITPAPLYLECWRRITSLQDERPKRRNFCLPDFSPLLQLTGFGAPATRMQETACAMFLGDFGCSSRLRRTSRTDTKTAFRDVSRDFGCGSRGFAA
jgi:hypothetical protein